MRSTLARCRLRVGRQGLGLRAAGPDQPGGPLLGKGPHAALPRRQSAGSARLSSLGVFLTSDFGLTALLP